MPATLTPRDLALEARPAGDAPPRAAGAAGVPLRAPDVGVGGERSARESQRAQIAGLERRVAAVPPQFVKGVRGRRGPGVLTLGELERARDELIDTLRAGERAAAREAEAQAAARARVESMLADPAAHRWERVAREELGETGCGAYHVRPRLGLLGMLAGWWEVKLSSGCPLCRPTP